MALSIAVLRNRDFRLLLGTRLFGAMALQGQSVIVGWQIYSLTHSTFLLGLAGLAEAAPALLCGLFAGHVVDSNRPYRVFFLCVSGLILNMLFLFLLGGGVIAPPAGNLVEWIFGGVFFSGIIRSFLMPSSFTLQSQIVPRAQMAAGSAWLSSAFQVAAVTGPAVAGLIYGGYGARTAWLLPISLMSIEFLLVCAIGRIHRHYRSQEKREPAVQSIKAGWRFIFSNRVLLSIMALDMFAVLFGGAVAMLPAFADQILHTGSQGLGLLRASPAAGSIVTALFLALIPMKKIYARSLLWVITGFGLSLFLALSGAFDSVSMVIRGTLMQLLTPDAMRGRVSSVNSMFIISSNEIGAFESGAAASLLGLVPSIVIGGIGTLVVVATTAILSPKLRRLVVDAEAGFKA
jgi:MFS family permease